MSKLQSNDQLAVDFASFFNGPLWERIHRHLRLMTIDTVCDPSVSSEQLRHLEGQRYLMGYIEGKINAGIDIKRKRGTEQQRSGDR